MAEDNIQVTAARRKRVQRLKKAIILMLIISVMIPIILCVILLVRLHSLSKTMDGLAGQINVLTETVEAQKKQMEELAAGEAVTVQGNTVAGENEREVCGEKIESPGGGEASEQDKMSSEVTAGHKVYLTFDDGPSIYTEDILDILDRYDVKATFFVLGKETDSAREALQDIVDRGHTLGMHSYTHKYSEIYASVEAFSDDFTKLRDYLQEITGVKSTVYRFPGGSSNKVSPLDMHLFAEYLDGENVRFFDWNISSGDGGKKLLSVEELVENSIEGIAERETSVILMHDSADKRTTVEALPIIIENILAQEDTVILPITDDTEPVQHIH